MIEQSVSLASNGVVKVPGYEQLVRFGYTKNRGVYRLAVTATGEWEGLAIRCFWHVPDGKDPASSLVVDGYVAVPASVTAKTGSGCVTFEGSDGFFDRVIAAEMVLLPPKIDVCTPSTVAVFTHTICARSGVLVDMSSDPCANRHERRAVRVSGAVNCLSFLSDIPVAICAMLD